MFNIIQDDSDEWEVETDGDKTENDHENDDKNNIKAKENPNPAPVRNQTAPQANSFCLYFPLSTAPWRRSFPEEDYMWTMNGIQTLLDQQVHILSEYKSIIPDGSAYLTIPRPRLVKRGSVERGNIGTKKERMTKKIKNRENILYEVGEL